MAITSIANGAELLHVAEDWVIRVWMIWRFALMGNVLHPELAGYSCGQCQKSPQSDHGEVILVECAEVSDGLSDVEQVRGSRQQGFTKGKVSLWMRRGGMS